MTSLNLNDMDVAAEQYGLTPLYVMGWYIDETDGCAYTISKINKEIMTDANDEVKVVKLGPSDDIFNMLWEGTQKDERVANFMEVFATAVYGQEE